MIALDVLRAVHERDAYANLVLPTRLRRARVTPADAAFITELTYGTLRFRGYYDAVISSASGRNLESIDSVVLDILRLGTHQLLGMATAPHAAVAETVTLAREAGVGRATGFVNAVLRRIARNDPSTWRASVLDGVINPRDRLALEHSHPAWVVDVFRAALDREGRGTELAELLIADNTPARVMLAALPGYCTPSDIGEPANFAPTAAWSSGGDPARNAAVAAGRARVQDEGSQLAALALSRARPIDSGERWLDLCSGPGGKATLLAAEAERGSATLVANEISASRARLVRTSLAPFGTRVQVRVGDGRALGATEPGFYDRVLVDAPCSGLGALRRRPEARWRKSPNDLAELVTLQRQLLHSALLAVRPGGLVAYVTCSPHPDETTEVVREALQHSEVAIEALDTVAVLSGISGTALDLGSLPNGAVQLWPHRHQTDAMFIQLIARR